MDLKYDFYLKNEVKPLASIALHEITNLEKVSGVLPLKKPDTYALYFVIKGKGTYTLAGNKFQVREGSIFAIYPGTEIKCRSDTKDPWSLITISFDGADARLLLIAGGFQPKTPVRHLERTIAEQAVLICAALSRFSVQTIFGSIQATAFMYTLMALLAKSASWDHTDIPPGWAGALHFQKAVKYIAENYSKPITVKDISAFVGVTYNRLYRIFMEQNLMPPQQYLTEFRIRQGCNLLKNRTYSIKEIAYAVGIEDPLYFSKVFKQFVGQSPTAYLKTVMKDEEHSLPKKGKQKKVKKRKNVI